MMRRLSIFVAVGLLSVFAGCATNPTTQHSHINYADNVPEDCFGVDWNITEAFFDEMNPGYKREDTFTMFGARRGFNSLKEFSDIDVISYINQEADLDLFGERGWLAYAFDKNTGELLAGGFRATYVDLRSAGIGYDPVPDAQGETYGEGSLRQLDRPDRVLEQVAAVYGQAYGRSEASEILGTRRHSVEYLWHDPRYSVVANTELASPGPIYTDIVLVKTEYLRDLFVLE